MSKVNSITIGERRFKVADIKRKYMDNIIDAAKKCDFIERIILFGSSIDERCKESSDIDLAIFGKHSPSRVLSSKKYERFARQLYSFDDHAQAYDLLYFKSGTREKSQIMDNINKGEVLYVQ